MFERLKRFFGYSVRAATQLPDVPVPKVPSKQQTLPSYLTTATPNTSTAFLIQDRNIVNTNLETYRTGASTRTVMRDFVATYPDLAASVWAYIRTAITANYTAVAYNRDGTFNRDATNLVQQLLVMFDILGNYQDGFSGINSMQSVAEQLAKELMQYGSCALELVLDKTRLPKTFQPVSTTQIQFYPDKNGGLSPIQLLSGTKIDLDIPTFFYTALDQDLLTSYSASPLEPALQPALFSVEFMNDLRRIVKRVVHPRLTVTVNEEKFMATVPAEIQGEPDKVRGFMNDRLAEIRDMVNGLNPEDAMVYFDSIGVQLLNNGNSTLSDEYTVLRDISDAKMATGAKTLPSILGHGSGSQNIASSETLLFMRSAAGVQAKLNEIFSRALTLAVRLFGQDVYVEFRYSPIDLRPEAELEAFKTMRQSRILELLSYGFYTDDEAALGMTGQLTPVGFKPLSGTQFYQAAKPDPNANPYTNSSTGGAGGGGPTNQKPTTPTQPKGKQKETA